MKALTICQPYARLIVVTREKRVENRTWATRYRGPLAIHAGKSWGWLRGDTPPPDMVFGAVVGVVDLVDCLRIEDIDRGAHDLKYPWIREHYHASGPFCWVLENVRRIKPVYCKGALSLWEWTPPGEVLA